MPPVFCTLMHAPVPAALHALIVSLQNAWQVPKTHVSPFAQPAVVVHGLPIAEVPAVMHAALPAESSMSHVSTEVHPHCGSTPHLLVAVAVLHEPASVPPSSGGGGGAGGGGAGA
jgi:hypothetical protein